LYLIAKGNTENQHEIEMNNPEALVEQILDFLSAHKLRATYTAVGEVIGFDRTAVARFLGQRRPRASWVVRADSGEPSGYSPADMDPCLFDDDHVIETGEELLELMRSSQSDYR